MNLKLLSIMQELIQNMKFNDFRLRPEGTCPLEWLSLYFTDGDLQGKSKGLRLISIVKLYDGVYLTTLMGILEDYFIPEYAYYSKPSCMEQKIENSKFLFELIEKAGLQSPNCMPEDIASGDLKSILRILYTMFSNYKDRE